MKTLFVLFSLLISVPALAHMKVGLYRGTTPEGQPCGFEVKSVSFVDEFHHPLNERVEIVAGNVALSLAHPALIDVAKGKVGFDHAVLLGSKAIRVGSVAALVQMDHSGEKDGPSEFTYLLQSSGDPASSSKLVCGNLVEP